MDNKPQESIVPETKTYKTCNGKINSNGICVECYFKAKTSSNHCGRVYEVQPQEEPKELPDFAKNLSMLELLELINEARSLADGIINENIVLKSKVAEQEEEIKKLKK